MVLQGENNRFAGSVPPDEITEALVGGRHVGQAVQEVHNNCILVYVLLQKVRS